MKSILSLCEAHSGRFCQWSASDFEFRTFGPGFRISKFGVSGAESFAGAPKLGVAARAPHRACGMAFSTTRERAIDGILLHPS